MSQEKEYRKVVKNTITLGGSQLVQMAVTLIRAKVVAILLGATGVGINSLILSVLSVMQQVSSVGIYQSGVREMSVISGEYQDRNRLIKFRKIFLSLSLICGLGGALLMILLSPIFSLLLFNSYNHTVWLIIASLTLVFMALHSGYGVIMQATQNVGLIAKASMVGGVSGLIFAILLFYFFRLEAIIPAIILNYATFYLSFRYFEHKIGLNTISKYTRYEFLVCSKPILKLGVILMASMIVATLFSFILNLFINHYGSLEEVGLYQSAASIMTQGMLIVNVILASDFFPRISIVHSNNIEMKKLIKQQTNIILFIIAPISVLIISLAPIIVWLLLSPQFKPVIGLIRIMGIALIFKSIWMMMSYIILAKGDKKSFFLFDALLGNGINVILSIIGFYYGGLKGLAFAYLAGAIFMVTLLFSITKKRYRCSLDINDLLKIAGLSLYLITTYLIATKVQNTAGYCILSAVCILINCYSLIQLNKKIDIIELIKNRFKL